MQKKFGIFHTLHLIIIIYFPKQSQSMSIIQVKNPTITNIAFLAIGALAGVLISKLFKNYFHKPVVINDESNAGPELPVNESVVTFE